LGTGERSDTFGFNGFTTRFGGVWGASPLGCPVPTSSHGGGQAVIVRLENGADGTAARCNYVNRSLGAALMGAREDCAATR